MEAVWEWERFESWRQTILSLMADVLTPGVFQAFRTSPPEFVVGDDLGWLDEIIATHGTDDVSSKVLLSERLRAHYLSIRAYHGSRPLDPSSIRQQGLRRLDARAGLAWLQSFFEQAGHAVEPAALMSAAERVGEEGRTGRLFFEANRQFLVCHCSHYMLYGSEYINAVSVHISERHRALLRTVGTPTVFVCNVPLTMLSDGQVADFAGSALQSLFLAELDSNYPHVTKHTASGLDIKDDLLPEFVVDHFHPERLHDHYTHELVRIRHPVASEAS